MVYAVVFTALPIVAVAWAWTVGAVNVPKWDDHGALKGFLMALNEETSVSGAVALFVKQHNEHRIAYDRLLAWLDYSLFGKLSFVRLMACGNLSLLGIVSLLGVVLARYTKPWYLFLPPITLLLVSLAHWENLYWAMASIQNFSVVFWVLWSLYALSHRSNPALAIGLAVVASLVSGNGLLVWPVGTLVLLLQRRFQLLPYWLGVTAALFAAYFWTYVQPATNPPVRGTVAEFVIGWLAFLGAAADALPITQTYWPAAITGALLVAFWGYVLVTAAPTVWRKTALSPLDSFMPGAVAFLVGTALVVVWGRYGFGRDILLTSRYRVYSLTLLAFTYVYSVSVIYKNYPFWTAGLGFTIGGVIWWSAFVVNTHESLLLRRYLLTSQYNWTYTTNRPIPVVDAATRRVIDNAPAYYDSVLPMLFSDPTGASFPVDSVFKNDQQYVIRLGLAGVRAVGDPSLANPDRGMSVLLRSSGRTYLYGGFAAPRRNWRVLVGRLPRYVTNVPIDVVIPASDLAPGTYEVAVLGCTNSTSCRVYPTGRLLTVAPHAAAIEVNKNW